MPQDLPSDQESDDAEVEFVEVDPTGRYGRVSSSNSITFVSVFLHPFRSNFDCHCMVLISF